MVSMLNRLTKAFIFAGGMTAGVAMLGLPAQAHDAAKHGDTKAAAHHAHKDFKHAGTYGTAKETEVDRLNQQSLQAAQKGVADVPAGTTPPAAAGVPDTGTSTGVTK
ncbi:putative secreted protein [Granulibacter bethesdensis]|uniref:Secreted protein n=2 Tax=Granulibacter bethesdensis TaxID=364410 RepID=Q0BQY0_GRABC|nr:putative secreted protein [Granulibacter bethesdensis CGDNIH1]AHJ68281.1 putative secreted protein [Granulibacter bethesdensis]APH52635.1 putative secreted protein [Granulibacter bethesdensis]APH57693.1 putative secreted protein [Granulibacter bethesdensis]APH65324.1 putative secreted protein [Granulibacter bethesdensis]